MLGPVVLSPVVSTVRSDSFRSVSPGLTAVPEDTTEKNDVLNYFRATTVLLSSTISITKVSGLV